MRDNYYILFFVLIVWLILFLLLEYIFINKEIKEVKKAFFELDALFIKRMNVLSKMIDIIKQYDKNQFDDFGSRLYDYLSFYDDYDFNKKISINELIEIDIKRVLLVSTAYPELKNTSKYVKYEKKLIRYSKVIKRFKIKYNKVLDYYYERKNCLSRYLLCNILKFYKFNYFEIEK